jgi:hypothetical protein
MDDFAIHDHVIRGSVVIGGEDSRHEKKQGRSHPQKGSA